MFFPRKPGLRRGRQNPQKSAHPDDELRPHLKLSQLEVMALLLMIR